MILVVRCKDESEVHVNSEALRKLFEQVRKRKLSADEAVERLRHLPFEDLGFAKVDHHRALRQGMPEVIFSQGKTPRQVAETVGASRFVIPVVRCKD